MPTDSSTTLPVCWAMELWWASDPGLAHVIVHRAWRTKPTWFTPSCFDGESGAKTTSTHQSTCLGPLSYYRWKSNHWLVKMSSLLHLNSVKRKEGELSSSSLLPPSSAIPHNLLLASLPTTFPQSGLLLIHSITHGKILIFFFPRLNIQKGMTSPETPPGGGDHRLPITQPAERQWEAGAGNHHISQFVSLEPPWLPALIPCFALLKTIPRVVLCQGLGGC